MFVFHHSCQAADQHILSQVCARLHVDVGADNSSLADVDLAKLQFPVVHHVPQHHRPFFNDCVVFDRDALGLDRRKCIPKYVAAHLGSKDPKINAHQRSALNIEPEYLKHQSLYRTCKSPKQHPSSIELAFSAAEISNGNYQQVEQHQECDHHQVASRHQEKVRQLGCDGHILSG